MSRQLCPLLMIIANTTIDQATEIESLYCIKEKCAWYVNDKFNDVYECAIKSIGQAALAKQFN